MTRAATISRPERELPGQPHRSIAVLALLGAARLAAGPAVRALARSVADAVETVAPTLRGTPGGDRGGQRARGLLS